MSQALLSRPLTAVAVVALAAVVVPLASAPPASAAATAYAVTATVPVGAAPDGAAVDPSTHAVYVTNSSDDTVSVIDGATDTVTATVGVGSNPFGVAVDPSTHTVYVTNFGGSSVSVIDGTTNTVTATVGVGIAPYAVAVDASTHRVYVANYFDDSVSVIDGTTNAGIATITVGANPRAIAADPSTHTVYATNYNDDSVSVIDGTTNQVITTVTGMDSPIGAAVDPSNHNAYITNYFSNSVAVIDGTTHAVSSSFGVGIHPYGVAVDPSTHTVYTANRADNTVSVVDGSHNTGLATLAVGVSPIGMAVDPTTHTAYATNSDSTSVSVISAGNVPAVNGVSPTAGPATGGQSVTVTGSDLTGATTVAFGTTAATSFTVDSPTQITAVAPSSGAGTVDVTVTTPFGTSPTSSLDRFTFVASPTLATTPSAGTAAGGTISDSAVLSNGSSPSGTVTFTLYGPTDPSCTGTAVATTTVGVSGGAADSAAITVTAAGTYRWTAQYSGDATNQQAFSGCGDDTVVTPAELNHLVVTPATAPVVAGDLQAFTAEAFDAYGNSRGDVTADTTFLIRGGACDGSTCWPPPAPGRYTVTAAFGGMSASATVRVTPAGLDHLTIVPRLKTVTAGGSQAYVVSAYDRYGNFRSKVAASLSINRGGTCTGSTCTPSTTAGLSTVTASFGGTSVTATLRVTPAALDHLTVTPRLTTVTAGASQAYVVSAYDRYGNFRAKVAASLSISGGGTCNGSTCTPSTTPGLSTVTASFGGKTVTATLRVTRAAGQTARAGW